MVMRFTASKVLFVGLSLLMGSAGLRPAMADVDWGLVAKNCLKDAAGAGLGSAFGPLGALCGGVAGSLAIMVSPPSGDPVGTGVANPANTRDRLGSLHNQLLLDYCREHPSYELASFYRFVQENKERYGEGKLPSMEQVRQAAEGASGNRPSVEGLLSRIGEQFKAAGIKQDIAGQLSRIIPRSGTRGTSVESFAAAVREIEDKALQAGGLSEAQVLHVSAFFSVLRHSAALWAGASSKGESKPEGKRVIKFPNGPGPTVPEYPESKIKFPNGPEPTVSEDPERPFRGEESEKPRR